MILSFWLFLPGSLISCFCAQYLQLLYSYVLPFANVWYFISTFLSKMRIKTFLNESFIKFWKCSEYTANGQQRSINYANLIL